MGQAETERMCKGALENGEVIPQTDGNVTDGISDEKSSKS